MAVFLTHPLSPNPFPPSPGRKGGPYFASGVRHRVNRERLKSGLVRQELTRLVPSAGGGMGWVQLETDSDPVAGPGSGPGSGPGPGAGAGGGVLFRRWRAAASQRVCSRVGTCYDRSRPILPCGDSRDLRAVEAFPDGQPSNEAPPSHPGEGGKGAGGIGGEERKRPKHKQQGQEGRVSGQLRSPEPTL